MDPGSEKAAMEFIEKFYEGESTGHDYWHSIRVYNMAMAICDTEPEADRDIVGMAALLHDLDDRKLGGDDENLPVASGFLKTHGATQSERGGSVYSELVGAAGVGDESYVHFPVREDL